MLTLQQLIDQLTYLKSLGSVGGSAPVIVEGWDDEGEFVQASVASVTTEARCEDDDEDQAVYINLTGDLEAPSGCKAGE